MCNFAALMRVYHASMMRESLRPSEVVATGSAFSASALFGALAFLGAGLSAFAAEAAFLLGAIAARTKERAGLPCDRYARAGLAVVKQEYNIVRMR